jgi:hypothetical protein
MLFEICTRCRVSFEIKVPILYIMHGFNEFHLVTAHVTNALRCRLTWWYFLCLSWSKRARWSQRINTRVWIVLLWVQQCIWKLCGNGQWHKRGLKTILELIQNAMHEGTYLAWINNCINGNAIFVFSGLWYVHSVILKHEIEIWTAREIWTFWDAKQ